MTGAARLWSRGRADPPPPPIGDPAYARATAAGRGPSCGRLRHPGGGRAAAVRRSGDGRVRRPGVRDFTEPGYNPRSRLLLRPTVEVPPVILDGERTGPSAAAWLIDNLLADFPLETSADVGERPGRRRHLERAPGHPGSHAHVRLPGSDRRRGRRHGALVSRVVHRRPGRPADHAGAALVPRAGLRRPRRRRPQRRQPPAWSAWLPGCAGAWRAPSECPSCAWRAACGSCCRPSCASW